MTQAWNLLFESESGASLLPGGEEFAPRPDTEPVGWTGPKGPGIEWKHWPRSEQTRLPMMHVLTLRLPEDYQRRGSDFVAISFFAGEGQFAEEADVELAADSEDPFVRDLAAAEEHPQLLRRRDIIDGEFALLWLRESELQSTAPLPDPRRQDEHEDDSEGHNAWDNDVPAGAIWLVERADPNAGQTPTEDESPQWQPAYGDDHEWTNWAAPLLGFCHLGGTPFPVQALPDGLTPWYLELWDFEDLNFGGGAGQIDLESDTFDWACG